MSLFVRHIFREFLRNTIGILLLLLAVIMAILSIRYLTQVNNGKLGAEFVFVFILLVAINNLAIALMLSCFLGVLMTVIRVTSDLEYIIWWGSSQSLWAWLKPLSLLTVPAFLISSALVFYVIPWSDRQTDQYRDNFEKRDDIARLASGQFQESSGGNKVFFVEAIGDKSNEISNIFLFSRETKTNKETIILAQRGGISTTPEGSRLITLDHGQEYGHTPLKKDYEIVSFEHYQIEIDAPKSNKQRQILSSLTLLAGFYDNVNYQKEIAKRLAIPIMVLLLPLFALVYGTSSPRSGRALAFALALLTYLLYNNLALYLISQIREDRLSFAWATWPLHITALLCAVLGILYRNQNLNPLLARIRRR